MLISNTSLDSGDARVNAQLFDDLWAYAVELREQAASVAGHRPAPD
ncbi:hypothetical protein [Xanthomonas citri]|nr:hypothetical protein [Xanthomonas citri]